MSKWLIPLIQQFIVMMSPHLIAEIQKSVNEWVQKAKETENPWDDILPGLLQAIIGKPQ
jgi:hypothetical protein